MADFSPISTLELAERLLTAIAFGTVIGWDREYANKPAGLRTNMLVSLGSALFILVPIQVGAVQENVEVLSRCIQGIITGVGFIGAGSILREDRVRGLTSAAAVWITSSLGLAAGLGLWKLGLLGLVFAFTILRVMKLLEKHLI